MFTTNKGKMLPKKKTISEDTEKVITTHALANQLKHVCPNCKGTKFKTKKKGDSWVCRACNAVKHF